MKHLGIAAAAAALTIAVHPHTLGTAALTYLGALASLYEIADQIQKDGGDDASKD